MAVFDVIPGNFFSVLTSPNREIYVQALLLLHRRIQYELNIRVEDYLSALISLLEDRDYTPEEDDELPEGTLTYSGKARLILARFVRTGWVEREYLDGSFAEIITPRPYAIPVMKLLREMDAGGVREYNSLVFATYSGLKQAKEENPEQMYEAVLSAKRNTEQLEEELRSLYHGIRTYLREIERQSDVNDLLQNHFERYKQMSDHIYHPIKTMDSIHRYRGPIQGLLTAVLADEGLMQAMCERARRVKHYEQPGEAREDILAAINEVLDAYETVGGIVTEIDRKHSAYTKRSIEKIRYLMTADQSVEGKLAQVLKAYAAASGAEKENVGELLERHVSVDRQAFLDSRSLYHKSARARRTDVPPMAVEKEAPLPEDLMRGMMAHLKDGYPLSRVSAYVDMLFAGGDKEIRTEDILLDTDQDFLLLLMAALRASDPEADFTVETEPGMVERGGYRVPRMTIRKKEAAHHVE